MFFTQDSHFSQELSVVGQRRELPIISFLRLPDYFMLAPDVKTFVIFYNIKTLISGKSTIWLTQQQPQYAVYWHIVKQTTKY